MNAQERRAQLEQGLHQVHRRIQDACSAVGRSADEVTLIVVTKFFPASDVATLAELGVKDVAENRHQEAVSKREECHDLGLTWHFVGGLQSNKAAAVGGWADVVQSVDRQRLIGGLGRAAEDRGRSLPVTVQVSLDSPQSGRGRSGVPAAELSALVDAVLAADGLDLRGLMAVAPRDADPSEAFERLAALAARVREQAPDATWLSAGMSHDLEQAITHGATHVRVGSAVLGNRPQRG